MTGLWKADMRLGRKPHVPASPLARASAGRPRRARLSDADQAAFHAKLEVVWLSFTQKAHREALRDKHWTYG